MCSNGIYLCQKEAAITKAILSYQIHANHVHNYGMKLWKKKHFLSTHCQYGLSWKKNFGCEKSV